MKLGVTTANPIAKLLALAGVLPTPLLDGYWGMMSGRCLIVAVKLGVFDSLSTGPRTATEVAREIGCDETGTETLLNALNGFGYIRRRKGRYTNRAATRRWLERDARFSMQPAFGLFDILWDELDRMEERLLDGGDPDFHAGRDAEFWERYQAALAAFAKLASREIVRRVRFERPPERLLDIGGGHGTYAAAFCQRYPHLHATVLDLPGATAVGERLVADAGLADRVDWIADDFGSHDLGSGYDAVLLFNVVHIVGRDDVPALLARIRECLLPGGMLVLLDSAHAGGTRDLDAAGGANELLFWVINGTAAYPEEDMVGWLADSGFRSIRTRHLLSVPQSALITGRV